MFCLGLLGDQHKSQYFQNCPKCSMVHIHNSLPQNIKDVEKVSFFKKDVLKYLLTKGISPGNFPMLCIEAAQTISCLFLEVAALQEQWCCDRAMYIA
jgi:hypothetical protein